MQTLILQQELAAAYRALHFGLNTVDGCVKTHLFNAISMVAEEAKDAKAWEQQEEAEHQRRLADLRSAARW